MTPPPPHVPVSQIGQHLQSRPDPDNGDLLLPELSRSAVNVHRGLLLLSLLLPLWSAEGKRRREEPHWFLLLFPWRRRERPGCCRFELWKEFCTSGPIISQVGKGGCQEHLGAGGGEVGVPCPSWANPAEKPHHPEKRSWRGPLARCFDPTSAG